MGKGIKFKAFVPVSITSIAAFGTDYHDLGDATWSPMGPRLFVVSQRFVNPDTKQEFAVDFEVSGKGFKYFNGGPLDDRPRDGTIKKVKCVVDLDPAFTVTGLKITPQEAIKLWSGDPFEAFAKLLTGDDTIIGSPSADPLLWGGKGNDLMWGRGGLDIVNGFKGNDVNDGGGGNDQLIDTKGEDTFQFSTPILTGAGNLNFNFDTIRKFGAGDEIYLKYSIFPAAGMEVSKGELSFTEQAQDKNDFFLFFAGIFSYDDDANGPHPATPIFQIENDATLKHWQLEIGIHGDLY